MRKISVECVRKDRKARTVIELSLSEEGLEHICYVSSSKDI